MKPKIVTVNDNFQTGYQYELTEPVGENYNPDFSPHLTPPEMLEIGVFSGTYFSDKTKELPDVWYAKAKLTDDPKGDKHLNFFEVTAGTSLKYWQEKGWIHSDDPRGWFQWYCRYYLGRRHADDQRQIKRWKAFRRHWVPVEKMCQKGDYFCRPRQRQALLHWAYDSREI